MTKARLTLALITGAAAAVWLSAAPAWAQRREQIPDTPQEAVPFPEVMESTNNKALDRRLDRDEKALRQLRSIVLKAQAQGSPVEVKPVGPDPMVLDLQQKFSDMEDTLRRLNGQSDQLRFDLEQTKRDLVAARNQLDAANQRIDQLQQKLQAAVAPQADPSGEGGDSAPAQATAPSSGGEAEDYRAARAMLDTGDFGGAAQAMQDFIARYPNSSRVPTAYYWSGRAFAARNQPLEAAQAFARSLKGWPQAAWASDASAGLASALAAAKRPTDACKALAEFDSRYAHKASAASKAQAARVRSAASCG